MCLIAVSSAEIERDLVEEEEAEAVATQSARAEEGSKSEEVAVDTGESAASGKSTQAV